MNLQDAISRRVPLLTGWLVYYGPPKNLAGRVSSTVRTLPAVRLCALLLGSIVLGSALCAQTAQTAPLQLTLKDTVALALKQNIDVQVANINRAASQQDRKISRSALLPQASLRATDEVERYNLQGLIGVPIQGLSKNIGPFQSINIGPRFSTPVFDLSLIRKYQASGHRLEASREDEKSTREETVLLTAAQYLALLRAKASVKAAESRVQLAESLAQQARDLLSSGVATNIDVSRAEVRVLTEKQALVDAQSEIESDTFALRRILNVSDSQQLEFLDGDTFSQTPLLDVSDPVSTALSQRPELLALSQRQEAAKEDRKAATAESLPELTFAGGWNEQGRTLQGIYPGYDYRASFNVPIFTGGRLSAERKNAQLAEQKVHEQLLDARNRVEEQVREGLVELQASRSDVDLGRQRLTLANQEVELARGRFAAGVTDNIEVTTAQDELAHASDVEIQALYRYNIARANLARAAGVIERVYLQQ
jgi:outer membrane protein TolC